jgi:hypothetical protein
MQDQPQYIQFKGDMFKDNGKINKNRRQGVIARKIDFSSYPLPKSY